MYEMAESQLEIFPALTGMASIAGLGVAWWLYARLNRQTSDVIGPLRDFRFNDHYVWIFIGGVMLLATTLSDPLDRVGSNAVAFMGALLRFAWGSRVRVCKWRLLVVRIRDDGFGTVSVDPRGTWCRDGDRDR